MKTTEKTAFICDIDGTVALHVNPDGTQRRGHYDYTKVAEDLPNIPVIYVVTILAASLQPVFLSGREDYSRSDTRKWIDEHIDPSGMIPSMRNYPLFMRENGNHEKDFELKGRLYDNYIAPTWDIKFAIDDRLQVCQMWHRIGVPVFRVGDPDSVF